MSDQTIESDAIISGVTYKTISAQSIVVHVVTNTVNSSAVIITGEPNVKLYMVE